MAKALSDGNFSAYIIGKKTYKKQGQICKEGKNYWIFLSF
jgi:hypothetical protein